MLFPSRLRFVAPLATVTVLLAACGGAAAPSATAAPTAAATTSAPPSASATTSTTTGKTKDVTFDATAHRSGNELTATTTASPTWKFADFGMTAPSVPFRVVSVVDEIRLVVDIVATVKA